MVKRPEIIGYLEAALKAAGLQQSAIANNIANLDTPGYRRSTVAFKKHLTEAISAGESINPKDIQE